MRVTQLKNSTTPVFRSATLLALAVMCSCSPVFAQDDMVYRVRYDRTTPGVVHVSLGLTVFGTAPLTLIMPRSFPGGYVQRPYDPYVSNVKAFGANGDAIAVQREELGPRWSIGQCCARVTRIEYDVDVAQMEREIFAASDSSKIRDGYVGLLGYSVFAFLDGWETRSITLEIAAPEGWPVFATLAPTVPAPTAALTAHAPDYYALADSQIMMGPKLQLRRIDGGAPLFVAAYTEGDADLAQEAALAREALDKVIAYFGKAPFSNYSVALEFLKPVSPRHEYGFSMEHLNSGTFYLELGNALTSRSTDSEKEAHRFNYAHHIAHSWIPKRAYGAGYFPFTLGNGTRHRHHLVQRRIWPLCGDCGTGRRSAEGRSGTLPVSKAGSFARHRRGCTGIPATHATGRAFARGIVSVRRGFSCRHEFVRTRRVDGCGNGRSHSRANRREEIIARCAASPDGLERAESTCVSYRGAAGNFSRGHRCEHGRHSRSLDAGSDSATAVADAGGASADGAVTCAEW